MSGDPLGESGTIGWRWDTAKYFLYVEVKVNCGEKKKEVYTYRRLCRSKLPGSQPTRSDDEENVVESSPKPICTII
jgi:hypothetical protein